MLRCLSSKITLRAVALLEFLAGTAGARIVPANLLLTANNLLHLRSLAATRHAGLLQFAPLSAQERFFQIVG